MEVIVLDSVAYKKLREELFDFLSKKFEQQKEGSRTGKDEAWVGVKDAMRLLKVGRTKLQQMKNDGVIHFSQYGRKLRFSRKSIEDFLMKHSTY